MNIIQTYIAKADVVQRERNFLGFPYAVVKKYGEDNAGYQAALLTYYGFLSLFPLLLVLTTIAHIVSGNNPDMQRMIIDSVTKYFPAFGNQLAGSKQTIGGNGPALIFGTLFALYGARGVADAFRHGVYQIWQIPLTQRTGFPKSILKSIGILGVTGLGLIIGSVSAGYASSAGRGFGIAVVTAVINIVVLFVLFQIILKISLPSRVSLMDTRSAALVAALGLVLLQTAGSFVLTSQLRHLDALYANFALALGLLFYLYLQAQVVYYALVIAAVKSQRLWPRSIDAANLTAADRLSYTRRAAQEQIVPEQKITTTFLKHNPQPDIAAQQPKRVKV
jgi:YihY family inner membrane protein